MTKQVGAGLAYILESEHADQVQKVIQSSRIETVSSGTISIHCATLTNSETRE